MTLYKGTHWDTILCPLEWLNLKGLTTNVGKDLEQLKLSYNAGGSVKWYNFGEQFGNFF